MAKKSTKKTSAVVTAPAPEKRLDTLTPEQEAMMPIVRDEWIAIGLATGPGDERRAERGVVMAYEAAGLLPPERFVWADSPRAGALIAHDLAVEAGEASTPADQISRAVYGAHDAGWLSFYDFFARCGIECCKKLEGLQTVAKEAGWWWAFSDVAVITRRPTKLHVDDQGRLHCATGAAVLYADGFAVHSWRGTRIPAEWIEDAKNVDPKHVLTWPNTEQRRCLAEIIGWGRVVETLNAKVIDSHPDPRMGELLLVDPMPGTDEDPRGVFLRVRCPAGGGREFCLRVHPDTKTVIQAQQRGYPMFSEQQIAASRVRT